ncbi:hypothetical protein R3P38DRAFT_3263123 [Favolaschia claudopus]|uniref:Uncharacterized protein n=1 Tax=Favolaschia claudopus TaxID=2862362 RepID=A0AAW0C909_9AGAR
MGAGDELLVGRVRMGEWEAGAGLAGEAGWMGLRAPTSEAASPGYELDVAFFLRVVACLTGFSLSLPFTYSVSYPCFTWMMSKMLDTRLDEEQDVSRSLHHPMIEERESGEYGPDNTGAVLRY